MAVRENLIREVNQMADDNEKINKTLKQPAHENTEPERVINPMKAANAPQMPTRLEFAQDQTKDNSTQESDSK